MTEPAQDPLFAQPKPVTPLRVLTDRQDAIYRLICSVPGGVEPIQLGALIHAGQGRHPGDEFCEWCPQDGARALREKAIRCRVVRRPGPLYEAREVADRAPGELTEPIVSQQVDVLPGESFEDIFGDAA